MVLSYKQLRWIANAQLIPALQPAVSEKWFHDLCKFTEQIFMLQAEESFEMCAQFVFLMQMANQIM